MSATLLQTKFYRPPTRADLVPRTRLLSQLDRGLQPGHRLVLLCAPAGYGKTSLLGAWAAGWSGHVAWLSLDEADNDPVRFWTYLVTALRKLQPCPAREPLGQALLMALQSPQPPALPVLLTDLLNDIDSLPDPSALVLDDLHTISSSQIFGGMAFLLDHLPPHVHLLISTRTDPLLPLARLRARGQLAQIRAEDLRFTPGEIADFLDRRAGIRLEAPDIAGLEACTEGWAAGLQMAALSLGSARDAGSLVKAFSGSNRYVMDYLAEEVLSRQPPAVERFLLQTSVLDRLCAPLCEAVLADHASQPGNGGPPPASAQDMLEHLERANLFVLPLDDERRWYRYHYLFADLLRARRRARQPGRVAGLHRRAADWFASSGLVDEAIHHALAAGEHDLAVRFIEHSFADRLLIGQGPTVLAWTAALPEDVVRSRPWLCVARASVHAFALRPAEAAPWLAQAASQASGEAGTGEERELLGNIAAFGALVAATEGHYGRSIELAQESEGLLPEGDPLRAIVPFALGHACLAEGDLPGAERAFARGVQMSLAAGSIVNIAVAIAELARVRKIQGQLSAACELYQDLLHRARQQGAEQSWILSAAELSLCDVSMERYDLDQARRWLERAGARTRAADQPDDEAAARLTRARLLWAEGDAESAERELREAVRLQQAAALPPLLSRTIDSMRVRLWLARGDQASAERWVEENGLRSGRTCLQREAGKQIEARVLVGAARTLGAGHKLDEAAALLGNLADDARLGGRGRSLIEILALLALAWQLKGDGTRAQAILEEALSLAEPEGYVRTFVEEGEEMHSLIVRWRDAQAREAQDTEPAARRRLAYAGKLLAAFAQHPKSGNAEDVPAAGAIRSQDRSGQELAEPLTEREREILDLVAAGLATEHIARRLIIAPGTVKAHLASIYSKLDVHSRTQALARARALYLIEG
jgi:LuxR family maltose regulon positive regulatory protein